MLKKILAAALFASALTSAAAPAQARTDGFEACMIRSGCFLVTEDTGSYWVCSDPIKFMLCDEAAGGGNP